MRVVETLEVRARLAEHATRVTITTEVIHEMFHALNCGFEIK